MSMNPILQTLRRMRIKAMQRLRAVRSKHLFTARSSRKVDSRPGYHQGGF